MKPKAPKQTRLLDSAVLAAWLAVIAAAVSAETTAQVIPVAYRAE